MLTSSTAHRSSSRLSSMAPITYPYGLLARLEAICIRDFVLIER